MNSALAALVAGEDQEARRRFDELSKEPPYSIGKNDGTSPPSFSKQVSSLPSQINRSPLGSPDCIQSKTSRLSVSSASACTTGQLATRQTPARSSCRSSMQPCPSLKTGSTNSSYWLQTMHPTAIGSRSRERPRHGNGRIFRPGAGRGAAAPGTGRTQTRRKVGDAIKGHRSRLVAKGATP